MLTPTQQEFAMKKTILMVVTSNALMGDTLKPTGIWAEELAVPYFAFTDAGFNVEIASPKGGPAPFDPNSVKPAGKNDAAVERMLGDAELTAKTQSTVMVSAMKDRSFAAVFFPGGHGTMWDMADNGDVARIVESAQAHAIPLGAVCHGVAALISAKASDGTPFVQGRKVNSFTDAEEAAAGLTGDMPFLLETRLRSLGAKFEGGANWQAYSVRDGMLFTGQNPASSALVANDMLTALRAA
jgi:putative intracellular protease/amidase